MVGSAEKSDVSAVKLLLLSSQHKDFRNSCTCSSHTGMLVNSEQTWFLLSEISPAENQDLGRLLLLHLRASRLQGGPRRLLHHDGPGNGGGHIVSAEL